tara:strand:- start:1186 stop:1491 length:306 start_codon:yes stop_codon:yes gene_type:complete
MSYDNSADRERDVNPPEPKEHYEPDVDAQHDEWSLRQQEEKEKNMELTKQEIQREAIVDSLRKGRSEEQIEAINKAAIKHYPNNPYGLSMQILIQHSLLGE